MTTKRLVALFGFAVLNGNAHAGTAVENEIRRSVDDPCRSRLEYLVVTPEMHHLGCPGCNALALRGPDMARGWMVYFNAVATSGALKTPRMQFMLVMQAVENTAARRWMTGNAGSIPFADKAREIGLCR